MQINLLFQSGTNMILDLDFVTVLCLKQFMLSYARKVLYSICWKAFAAAVWAQWMHRGLLHFCHFQGHEHKDHSAFHPWNDFLSLYVQRHPFRDLAYFNTTRKGGKVQVGSSEIHTVSSPAFWRMRCPLQLSWCKSPLLWAHPPPWFLTLSFCSTSTHITA